MFWRPALAAAVLASAVRAGPSLLVADPLISLRSVDVLETSYDELVDRHFVKRQQVDSDSEIDLERTNGAMDAEAWRENTTATCREALSNLDVASNPSGIGICYNLPSLDTETGVFEADLRLFKVSEPSEQFLGVAAEDIQVGLSYSGASVSAVDPSEVSGGGMQGSTAQKRQDDGSDSSDGDELELLQTYMFVGQIDESRMEQDMSMAQLEAFVMPVLTLSASNSSGDNVSTTVSSNEAAFLTGVFSEFRPMSDFAMAEEAVANVTAQLAEQEVAFVLPGVQLMIFPIGLIITSIWLLVGVAAYGFGTYERIQYAESFKKRKAMAVNRRAPI